MSETVPAIIAGENGKPTPLSFLPTCSIYFWTNKINTCAFNSLLVDITKETGINWPGV